MTMLLMGLGRRVARLVCGVGRLEVLISMSVEVLVGRHPNVKHLVALGQ